MLKKLWKGILNMTTKTNEEETIQDDNNATSCSENELALEEVLEEKTPEQEESIEKLNINKQTCSKCGKEGWIKKDGFDDGRTLQRLCLTFRGILCLDCTEKA